MGRFLSTIAAFLKPKRRWFQFSLRTLLVVTALFALTLGITTEVLNPKVRIRGLVVFGERGQPAAGVTVDAQATDETIRAWCAKGFIPRSWATVVTDKKGRYRLPPLPAGKYNIGVRKAGYTVKALDSFQGKRFLPTEAPDLRLIRGGFITGRIIDIETGKPIHVPPSLRAQVGLYGLSRPRSGAAIDSAPIKQDGSFRIRAAPGRNYVYVCTPQIFYRLLTPMWVDVADGETVDIVMKATSDY